MSNTIDVTPIGVGIALPVAVGVLPTGVLPEEKRHRCEAEGCTYVTNDKSHLTRHKKTHTREKPFKCTHEGCSYEAAQSYDLKVHQRTHTGEKPYSCSAPGCGYKSGRSSHVHGHIKAVHKGDIAIFVVSDLASISGSTSTRPSRYLTKLDMAVVPVPEATEAAPPPPPAPTLAEVTADEGVMPLATII